MTVASGTSTLHRVADAVRREKQVYTQGEDRPVGSFLAVTSVYGAAVAGLSALVRARHRELPERLSAADLALMTVATHRLARTLAKDPVTSPLRAPFTQFAGTSGEAELHEEVRDGGVRHAVGELLTCPFCLAQWVGTGFVFGLLLAPRATRMVAGVFTIVAGADALQYAYAALQSTSGD
jgi:hypothetical protein